MIPAISKSVGCAQGFYTGRLCCLEGFPDDNQSCLCTTVSSSSSGAPRAGENDSSQREKDDFSEFLKNLTPKIFYPQSEAVCSCPPWAVKRVAATCARNAPKGEAGRDARSIRFIGRASGSVPKSRTWGNALEEKRRRRPEAGGAYRVSGVVAGAAWGRAEVSAAGVAAVTTRMTWYAAWVVPTLRRPWKSWEAKK